MKKVSEVVWEDALLLLASVRAALINGTRHYDKAGRLLRTETEVVRELIGQKEITLDHSCHIPVTSDEEQLSLVSREFKSRKLNYVG